MIDKIFPLAVSKGWDGQRTFDTTAPESAEADYVVYCQIHRWLQQKHFIHICVMPRYKTSNKDYIFSYFVMTWNNIQPNTVGGYDNYDSCFAAAIEAALKLIPNGENMG